MTSASTNKDDLYIHKQIIYKILLFANQNNTMSLERLNLSGKPELVMQS
jgi:hypothetical protein